MPPAPLVDPATIDTSKVLVDLEGIREANPQRFEMEQLTAIVRLDPAERLIIGYKDITEREFWVRGHMPDYPLMPGVLICEAAAQLSSYFVHTIKINEGAFMGFGGMEDVRFRGKVKPGDRLVLVSKADPRPSPPDDLRDPGVRRHQHGLSRPDHRRPALRNKRQRPTSPRERILEPRSQDDDRHAHDRRHPLHPRPGRLADARLLGRDSSATITPSRSRSARARASSSRTPPRPDPTVTSSASSWRRNTPGRAAERVAKKGLANVRVLPGDARRFMAVHCPPTSLHAVHVYFPDPWWKKRHKKRRVFAEPLVARHRAHPGPRRRPPRRHRRRGVFRRHPRPDGGPSAVRRAAVARARRTPSTTSTT